MAKKPTSSKQYFAGAALAFLLGAVYTLVMFQAILGPGMLVLGTVFLVLGLRRRKAESAAPSTTPAT